MSLIKNSLVATVAILLCRFTGLAREIVKVSLFGATGALDAFYTAFRIPNLLRDLFAEGALSQSYTSVATKVRELEGQEATWELTQKIFTLLSGIMMIIVTLGIVFAMPITELFYAQSDDKENVAFAAEMTAIMWPFIGFASLAALVMGALNMLGVFGLPMLASAAFNVASVVIGLGVGYYIDPEFGPRALIGFAIGVTFGGAVQLAVQLPRLRRAGFRWKLNPHWRDPHVYRIVGLMLPAVVASGITQFNLLINTQFALALQPGSVTALSNAFRIWQLPVGLFGVATGMVVLPTVARMMANNERAQVATLIAQGLRLVAFFAVPACVILALLGTEVISIFFQHGRFGSEATELTGRVLTAYSLGLLGYAGTKVVQPVFLALEKRWIPLITASVALCVSLALNYTFVYVLHYDAPWLALTTAVITTLTFLFFFGYLHRHLGGGWGHELWSGLLKITVAGAVLAGVCVAGKALLWSNFTALDFFSRLFLFGGVAGIGGITYLTVAWVLKTPELLMLKKRLRSSSVRRGNNET